jgi:hypothetical protein
MKTWFVLTMPNGMELPQFDDEAAARKYAAGQIQGDRWPKAIVAQAAALYEQRIELKITEADPKA